MKRPCPQFVCELPSTVSFCKATALKSLSPMSVLRSRRSSHPRSTVRIAIFDREIPSSKTNHVRIPTVWDALRSAIGLIQWHFVAQIYSKLHLQIIGDTRVGPGDHGQLCSNYRQPCSIRCYTNFMSEAKSAEDRCLEQLFRPYKRISSKVLLLNMRIELNVSTEQLQHEELEIRRWRTRKEFESNPTGSNLR